MASLCQLPGRALIPVLMEILLCVAGGTWAQDLWKVRITGSWNWYLPPQEAWFRKPDLNIETTCTLTSPTSCMTLASSTLSSMGSPRFGTEQTLLWFPTFLKVKRFSLPRQDVSSSSLWLISHCFLPHWLCSVLFAGSRDTLITFRAFGPLPPGSCVPVQVSSPVPFICRSVRDSTLAVSSYSRGLFWFIAIYIFIHFLV